MPRMTTKRWKPSVTVAAVIEREGRFLLVEEQTSDGLKLNNPAGHLEPGEAPVDGCIREVREETAYGFAPQGLVGVYLSRFRHTTSGEDVTYVRFAYHGDAADHDPGLALDEGIVRALWMGIDEIRACPERHRSPLLLRCIEDYLAGRRYPLDTVYADPSLADAPAPVGG